VLAGSSPLPAAAAEPAPAPVVINEIMYHPPEERDDLQFIELLNPGPTAVDLSGWSLEKRVRFTFPAGARAPAGGCVVVCRDAAAFKSQYPGATGVAGVFGGSLSHGGERLVLKDPAGRVVDSVKYADRAPWPLGADGYGSSLERICPAASGEDPANWTSGVLEGNTALGGSPGRANSGYSAVPLPRISGVRYEPAQAGRPVEVTAVAEDASGLESVTLAWWASSGEDQGTWIDLPMARASGDVRQGSFSASIPAQPEGRLIRFTVRARNTAGAERVSPSPTEPRPTYSTSTFANTNRARVPFLKVLTLGPMARPNQPRFRPPPARRGTDGLGPRQLWTSAVVYLPRDSQEVLVFDHVHLQARKGGWKVHFHKDQPLLEMTGINLLFESSPRWVLSEPLAYDLYRKVGVPSPISHHVRLWMDQRRIGYHLLVEQPNKAFLRRQGRDDNGNLYKLLWYGHGLVGQHEKKIHPHTGHQDLVDLVEGLNHTSGTAQWELIQKQFDVEEMINYYAASMCIQNWDGFWNNYYVLHDLRPGGRWEIFPWDEDKTWGDFDGSSSSYNWVEMPLNFGMNGDQPSSGSWLGRGPFGGPSWWRPPGHFSGPLLANPEFRSRFLARLREVCETVFTTERMGPAINALENRLEEEVRVRAELTGQDAASALQDFHNDIRSFRNQLVKRRSFILQQLGSSR
jgi:hypothetical protein